MQKRREIRQRQEEVAQKADAKLKEDQTDEGRRVIEAEFEELQSDLEQQQKEVEFKKTTKTESGNKITIATIKKAEIKDRNAIPIGVWQAIGQIKESDLKKYIEAHGDVPGVELIETKTLR